jgi:hypothetical protein
MLHVLLVLLHGSLGVSLAGEGDFRLAAGPVLRVQLDVNVDRVRHRAEPLRDVLLGHPERQAAHLTINRKKLLTDSKKNLVKKSVWGSVVDP